MSIRVLGLFAVIILFGALTAAALLEVGYFGILAPLFQSWGAAQVGADLVIFAVLACVWMVLDGRARGVSPWPFVLLTLVGGSFGLLFYLVRREARSRAVRPALA